MASEGKIAQGGHVRIDDTGLWKVFGCFGADTAAAGRRAWDCVACCQDPQRRRDHERRDGIR